MFFEASKIFWVLAKPGNLLLIMLLGGVVLLHTKWQRFARIAISIVGVLALLIATLPLGQWIMSPLEERFPFPTLLPSQIDGIIVLGGSIDSRLSAMRRQTQLNDTAERLIMAVSLARRFPEAKVVFTGGSGSLTRQDLKEAHFAKRLFAHLGFAPDRVIYEDQSRNTYENASLSQMLVNPKQGQVWLLVTSAFHMPRAVGCFRRVGWYVIPYPVDYRTKGEAANWSFAFNLTGGMHSLAYGMHEWLGLFFYWVSGRITALFPGPDN